MTIVKQHRADQEKEKGQEWQHGPGKEQSQETDLFAKGEKTVLPVKKARKEETKEENLGEEKDGHEPCQKIPQEK